MKVRLVPQFLLSMWSGEASKRPQPDSAFEKISRKVGKKAKPFYASSLLVSNNRRDQIAGILLDSGTEQKRLNIQHINIYNEAERIFNEKDWDKTRLAKDLASLINAGANSDKLETYLGLLFYYELCNAETSNLTKSFLTLIQSNLSEYNWHLFKSIASHHMENGWEVDKFALNFSKLVKSKPSEYVWDEYKNIVALFKERNWGLTSFTYYLSYLIQAKSSLALIKLYTSNFVDYRQNKSNTHSLTKSFVKLAQTKPTDTQVCALAEFLYQHKLFGLSEVEDIVNGFAGLVSASPQERQLQFFFDVLSYYVISHCEDSEFEYKDFIPLFVNLIKSKPSKDKWILYEHAAKQEIHAKRTLNNLTNDFSSLLCSKVLVEKWDDLAYTKEQGFGMHTLVSALAQMQNIGLTNEGNKFYRDSVETFKKNGYPIGNFTRGLALILEGNPSFLMWETYRDAVVFHLKCALPNRVCDPELNQIVQNFGYLAKLEPLDSMLKTYRTGLSNGQIKSSQESLNFFRDLVAHTAILNLTRNTSQDYILQLQNFISNFIRNDPVPFPQKDENGNVHPEAKRVYNQTLSVYRRAFDIYHGFSSLTFETKRPPTKEPPLLARFGSDVAKKVRYINAGDINGFPGKGFIISEIIPERVFVKKEEDLDPLHTYKEKWVWAKDTIDDLPKTHFIFTRGFVAVTCSDNKYKLKDVNGEMVHFSYIVFNDHHHNYGLDVAYLIPTEVLIRKLSGATIPYQDYVGFAPKVKDANKAGLTPYSLFQEASTLPANVINLGWGSNIGGGLCNAYPLDSSPYHKWEVELRPEPVHTKDIYGRVHKSHITGIWESKMTPSLEKLLLPLREAHDEVYRVANNYQNLFDLFRLTLAMWHKGETLGERLSPINDSFDRFSEYQGTPINEQWLEYGNDEDYYLNPSSLRMLVEAYKWHNQNKNNKNDFPVLAVSETLDYSTRPKSPFVLDTHDMKLKIGEEEIELPKDSNGLGVDEALIWFKHVMPHVKSFAKDLRFYDRRDLGVS